MAYNKKYAELGESVIDYVNNMNDAIESAFDGILSGNGFIEVNGYVLEFGSFYSADILANASVYLKYPSVGTKNVILMERRPRNIDMMLQPFGLTDSGVFYVRYRTKEDVVVDSAAFSFQYVVMYEKSVGKEE